MTTERDTERTLIDAVARCLGPEWRANVDQDRWLELAGPDVTLHCHASTYGAQRGRLTVRRSTQSRYCYRTDDSGVNECRRQGRRQKRSAA